MISNEKQYKITQEKADGFVRAIAEFDVASGERTDVHPRLIQAEREAMESQLEDLRREISEYERLRSSTSTGLRMGDMNYQVCTHWNVHDLLRMLGRSQLTPPSEFQRGPKWSRTQKQLYIDSLLRGYPSPAFYFHCDQPDAIIRRDTVLNFGVVDGQQRLNAMREFEGGAWSLLKSPDATPGGSKHFRWRRCMTPNGVAFGTEISVTT